MDGCWEQLVAVAGKGSQAEPHCDVVKALSDFWGIGGANYFMEG